MSEHAANLHDSAARWFGKAVDALDESEARALRHAKSRQVLARDPNEAFDDRMSFGERLADKVATFGGSWTFILLFCAFLVLWAIANIWLLTRPFDPYPFIFLNLMLSMLAALQAPVIMMSQNRQSAKDRHNAQLDYEVNLKAEIEIMALHEKLDRLRDENIVALLAKQQEQITLLTELVARRQDDGGAAGAR
ncbi:DUF1003 domain-containing protein [Methylopila musalis]|uniref:DUF1003 domain-containing protein n=1 Tax=Methylopila musalis TaxID=1134781 RepID=A0ABW3ZAR9_9HYPH